MDFVVDLAPGTDRPAYQRLAEGIRRGILESRFHPGDRLPPTRTLAKDLRLARNTILEAYDQLIAEGYLEARQGSGTFVATALPESSLRVPDAQTPPRTRPGARPLRLSAFGERALNGEAGALAFEPEEPEPPFNFRYGMPSYDDFPFELWRHLTKRVLDYPTRDILGYGSAEGLPALREAIAAYLGRSRGVRCAASQVLIVNGSQQALDLAARVLINPGDAVAIEEPCYPGARAVFQAAGARLASVSCDNEGLMVDRLPAARAVYVTPSHQFPSGVILSAARRLQLLEWAEHCDAAVIEDDYDSEFRYEGHPLGALQGLDRSGHVVYAGTFSKVLLPGLRLGYIVAPPRLHNALAATKWLTDRHVPSFYQAVLAIFIEEGHFERHLRRMRKMYDRRRAALLGALDEEFGGRVRVTGTESGMHVLVTLEGVRDATAFVRAARNAGVGLYSADPYYTETPPQEATFMFGYSNMPEERIREGVRRLARAEG